MQSLVLSSLSSAAIVFGVSMLLGFPFHHTPRDSLILLRPPVQVAWQQASEIVVAVEDPNFSQANDELLLSGIASRPLKKPYLDPISFIHFNPLVPQERLEESLSTMNPEMESISEPVTEVTMIVPMDQSEECVVDIDCLTSGASQIPVPPHPPEPPQHSTIRPATRKRRSSLKKIPKFTVRRYTSTAMQEFAQGNLLLGLHLLIIADSRGAKEKRNVDAKRRVVRSVEDAIQTAAEKLARSPDEIFMELREMEWKVPGWGEGVQQVHMESFRAALKSFRRAMVSLNPDVDVIFESSYDLKPWLDYYANLQGVNMHELSEVMKQLESEVQEARNALNERTEQTTVSVSTISIKKNPHSVIEMSGWEDPSVTSFLSLDEPPTSVPVAAASTGASKPPRPQLDQSSFKKVPKFTIRRYVATAMEEFSHDNFLLGLHLLIIADLRGTKEKKHPQTGRPLVQTVDDAINTAAEKLNKPLDDILLQLKEMEVRLPEWGQGVQLVDMEEFVSALNVFYRAMISLNPVVDVIFESCYDLKPWIEYYANIHCVNMNELRKVLTSLDQEAKDARAYLNGTLVQKSVEPAAEQPSPAVVNPSPHYVAGSELQAPDVGVVCITSVVGSNTCSQDSALVSNTEAPHVMPSRGDVFESVRLPVTEDDHPNGCIQVAKSPDEPVLRSHIHLTSPPPSPRPDRRVVKCLKMKQMKPLNQQTVYVRPSGEGSSTVVPSGTAENPFQSINQAVDAVGCDSTILLFAGVYPQLVLAQPPRGLTIAPTGDARCVISSSGSAPAILLLCADCCTIERLVVKGCIGLETVGCGLVQIVQNKFEINSMAYKKNGTDHTDTVRQYNIIKWTSPLQWWLTMELPHCFVLIGLIFNLLWSLLCTLSIMKDWLERMDAAHHRVQLYKVVLVLDIGVLQTGKAIFFWMVEALHPASPPSQKKKAATRYAF